MGRDFLRNGGIAASILLSLLLMSVGGWIFTHATLEYYLPPVGDGSATSHTYVSWTLRGSGGLFMLSGLAFLAQAVALPHQRRRLWIGGLALLFTLAGLLLLRVPPPVF